MIETHHSTFATLAPLDDRLQNAHLSIGGLFDEPS